MVRSTTCSGVVRHPEHRMSVDGETQRRHDKRDPSRFSKAIDQSQLTFIGSTLFFHWRPPTEAKLGFVSMFLHLSDGKI
jgi:hypothetical protein